MIAKIKLKETIYLQREEAEALGLKFDTDLREAGMTFSKHVRTMTSWYDHWIDEIDEVDGEFYEKLKPKKEGEDSEKEERKPLERKKVLQRINIESGYVRVGEEQLVSLLEFAPKCHLEYSVIQAIKETSDKPLMAIHEVFDKINTKVEHLDRAISKLPDVNFNSKCNVIANNLAVAFNETKLMEDACSDHLQEELNRGWRIIAVCVQPDQRRPDYVLGRYNPDSELPSGAAR